ncbi:UDP-N-acetylglucosamine 2-epimerase (non-hydrolyzing) [Dehalogenimonas formicexedens]|uniref:UDP-N-acetylglucosamine 2-epimerase (Non-hydrolyzing) n=1 Tax=Dehalogenimonas formicexedens TaxID=1839801 RepID=A0A1P8F9M6_9CHLR|nr:UDP-N-acetylglucosamine 2-epimerase (non-hydrolyzing) [Dehalogenimonas formicexedens]APV45145.1 UDP-N-acetylglucosamine 2-epimerase (non-hydrolyzing) [Dehalogenimonas formicexedens]
MKIVSVIGVRPQFIKCASLSRELRIHHREILVHTGQHYDYLMNKVFFDELDIPSPDYNLEVGSSSHGLQTGEMLKRIEEVLLIEKPDLVLVYGDTNSTLAGALAATKMHIKVAHVEAGLRSHDRTMPEEINRILTDHCSDLLFCPTQTATTTLADEGINRGVYLTGDVMVDAILFAKNRSENSNILEILGLTSKEYLMVTIHRASNTDTKANLDSLVNALIQLKQPVVFPLHPRTEKQLKHFGLFDILSSRVKLIKPLGYLEFTKLLGHSQKVLTDSGGVQKEAYLLQVPCVTLRDNTEWQETVQAGWNVLVGTNEEMIVNAAHNFQPVSIPKTLFPEGACRNICDILN